MQCGVAAAAPARWLHSSLLLPSRLVLLGAASPARRDSPPGVASTLPRRVNTRPAWLAAMRLTKVPRLPRLRAKCPEGVARYTAVAVSNAWSGRARQPGRFRSLRESDPGRRPTHPKSGSRPHRHPSGSLATLRRRVADGFATECEKPRSYGGVPTRLGIRHGFPAPSVV
jgi:hypothetical protein